MTVYRPSTKRPAKSSVITILLKTLIFGHLEVLDYHPGPAPAGLWRHALPYVFGDLWYGPRQRILGDDVDLQILRADHHPRDLLAALVGRGLDVASAPHRVDPFGREGRLGRDPRKLDSFCQDDLAPPSTGPVVVPGPPGRGAPARAAVGAPARPPAAGRRCWRP